jgi:fused signal recognition particle receptor
MNAVFNQWVDTITTFGGHMPAEYGWTILIFIVPLVFMWLLKLFSKLGGGRAPSQAPATSQPEAEATETPLTDTQPQPQAPAPPATEPAPKPEIKLVDKPTDEVPPDFESEPQTVVEPEAISDALPEEAKETILAPEPESEPEPELEPEPALGFFQRLKNGLAKTRNIFSSNLDGLFSGGRKLDDDMLEDLEELLITSDIGVQTAMDLIERITPKAQSIGDPQELKSILKTEIGALLQKQSDAQPAIKGSPHVIMVVGVNGVGKTTTIGKLAARYRQAGKKVLVAAADTFRAAAIEQITIWSERAGAEIVKHKDGADPGAVAFDGVAAAKARNIDIVLVDTAGRLHTKINLMEELKKIKRSIAKQLPDAPHETLLVLDATTGQNALSQAKLFDEAIDVNRIALTKLDGTAKGGIVVAICDSLNLPLAYIGVGEGIDDLQDFDAQQFAEALFD